MGETAIKKRLRTAKIAAVSFLRKRGYEVIYCNDHRFDLMAAKLRIVRLIKISVDEVKSDDRNKVESFGTHSKIIRKEIWCREHGKRNFDVVSIGVNPHPQASKRAYFKIAKQKHDTLKPGEKNYEFKRKNLRSPC